MSMSTSVGVSPFWSRCGRLLLIASAGTVAGVLVLLLFSGALKYAVLALGAVVGMVAWAFSGNPRLACLWGLLLTLPLELNKSFMIVPHMGGAAAISIDACDLFLVALTLFVLRDRVVYRRAVRLPLVLYWWIGLILLGMIDMLTGPMPRVSTLEVVRMLKLTWLFLILVNEVVRVKQFGHVVAALMVSILLQVIVGLLQYTFEINLGAQMLGEVTQDQAEYTSKATYLESEFTYRVGGLIGHPNLLAIFLAMGLPIGIALLFATINARYKTALLVVVTLGALVLVLTLSRSGWISFGMALMTILTASYLLPRMNRQYRFGKLAFIIGMALLMIAMSGPIIKRITKSDEGAVNFRWEWMEVAAAMAIDKPVLGFGLNTFVWFMPPYTQYQNYSGVVDKFGTDLPVVHNIYLLVWAEQGTLGLLFFLGLHAHLLWIAWQGLYCYRNSFLSMVNLGAMAGLLAVMADGMASFFIRNGNCGRIFILIIAMIVAIRYWHQCNEPPVKKSDKAPVKSPVKSPVKAKSNVLAPSHRDPFVGGSV